MANIRSLGFFKVTREMLECMTDNEIQVHFQYGKRAALTGATACFDHKEYIKQGRRDGRNVEVQDEIPFTCMNICHKNKPDQKRCFVFGYQVTIHVKDPGMIQPKIFAKIEFKGMLKKMLILPGDRVGVRFGTDMQPYEAIRLQPDINSATLPEPFKSRYQTPSGIRLPCNDVMIADSIQCVDTVIYCTDPEDSIKMHINGAGEIFSLDRKCKDFFQQNFDWNAEQKRLEDDTTEFANLYSDANGKPKEFTISEVKFKDSLGNEYSSNEDFKFSYTVGWRFISNYPKCYTGTSLKIFKPQCQLQCGSEQCLLKPLADPNSKRMLQAPMAG